MLLVASYVFYGTWNWKFLSLIFISTTFDYICGIKIHESTEIKKRKAFLFLSILGNLSILGFFKYYNFFASSLGGLLDYFGVSVELSILNFILPVGLSFYTFKAMSYAIDIYRKEIEPARKFLDFALYVSFFPQLIAGPIEKTNQLLPQIVATRKLKLTWFYEGCYLIFWGLFQKVFIADNLARIVNPVFAGPTYNGATVLLAIYAFAFQIFCDFAGYSNIARGLGRLMGFDIMVNFRMPYFSTNPREFWQRWHISLSTWLRDYLYIPLGGNRKGVIRTCRNLFLTMLLGGLWHGAAWTFVIWGAYHGILLVLQRIFQPLIKTFSFHNIIITKIWHLIRIIFFFQVICVGWLIFRARSISQVLEMLNSLFFNFSITPDVIHMLFYFIFFIFFLLTIQIFQYIYDDLMVVLKWPTYAKTSFVLIISYLFIYVMALGEDALIGGGRDFIYFQF
ncbi:MAG: MBOAT family O-acyltransferase [Thermodesulfovibrionia bacterium]|nr:MBOAT family O-acyltransferase [Thermodesulfovibrionia bacterium]